MRIILAGIVVALVSASCGALGAAPAVTPAVDCAVASVAKEVVELIPAVVAILEGGGTSWTAVLDALGKALGPDALACAVQAAATQLQPPASASAAASAEPVVSPAVGRAQQYIASHGFRFQGAP